jgi:N-acetylneuraminic acid mutarotase
MKTCQVYDPATSKWSAIASLPDGRSHCESSTIVRSGRVIIVGGRCNGSSPPRDVVNDLIEYDPQADRWSVLGSMPQPLLAPSAAIFDGRIFVTCGGLNNPRPLEATTRSAPLPPQH